MGTVETAKQRSLHPIAGGAVKASTVQLCTVWALEPDSRFDGGLYARVWLALINWQRMRSFAKAPTRTRLSLSELASAVEVKPWVLSHALSLFERVGLILERSERTVVLATDFGELHDADLAARARSMHSTMPQLRATAPCGHNATRLRSANDTVARAWFFIPRRLLVRLARLRRSRGKLATVFGHLVRGLYIRGKGLFDLKHLVTRGWIAEAFGVSERTVTASRRWLQETLGWLRNLGGPWFVVDGRWGGCGKPKRASSQASRQSAPQEPSGGREFAPIHQNLSSRGSDQKPPQTGSRRSSGGGGEPDPKNIRPSDLKSFERCMRLFDRMKHLGWVEDSLPERVAFAGSARDCLRLSPRNPGALLRHRIRSKRLSWCTTGGEAAIYERVKRFLGLLDPRPKAKRQAPQVQLPELSPDANRLLQHRGQRPAHWSLERFDNARLEVANRELYIKRHNAGLVSLVGGSA